MARKLLIPSLLLILGCSSPVDPGPLNSGYALITVDDQYLPVPFAPDGSVLLSASLGFGAVQRPREPDRSSGMVHYTILIRRPDQTAERSTVQLEYSIENAELRINLCPPLALCIASTELIGPVPGPGEELVLTHYLAGAAREVYRYFPTYPE